MTDFTSQAVDEQEKRSEGGRLRILRPDEIDSSPEMVMRNEERAREIMAGDKNRPGGGSGLYDTKALGGDLTAIEKNEEQGARIPNKYIKPGAVEIGGRDLSTGEQIRDYGEDEDGMIKQGVDRLRESSMDTQTGAPIQDLTGLAEVAVGYQGQGSTYEEYIAEVPEHWSEEQRRIAWIAASRAREQMDIEANIREHEGDAGEYSDEEVETVSDEQLSGDDEWLDSVARVYEAFEGRPFQGSREELHQLGLDEMSAFNYSAGSMAEAIIRLKSGDDDLKRSYHTMMTMYDSKEGNWDDFGRAVKSLGLDPTTYLSLGAGKIAMTAAQQAAKVGVSKWLAGYIGAGAAGAAIGSGFGAGIEAGRQTVEKEAGARDAYDGGAIGGMAGVGALGGAVVGDGPHLTTHRSD